MQYNPFPLELESLILLSDDIGVLRLTAQLSQSYNIIANELLMYAIVEELVVMPDCYNKHPHEDIDCECDYYYDYDLLNISQHQYGTIYTFYVYPSLYKCYQESYSVIKDNHTIYVNYCVYDDDVCGILSASDRKLYKNQLATIGREESFQIWSCEYDHISPKYKEFCHTRGISAGMVEVAIPHIIAKQFTNAPAGVTETFLGLLSHNTRN